MARKVFYSFHYKPDCHRAALVRNMGAVEGNASASDNDWEEVTKGGDPAIERWINGQLSGKSCAVILIGADTAGRKWINYELTTAWNEAKGVLGIYIHRLKDLSGLQTTQGANPFDSISMNRDSALAVINSQSLQPSIYRQQTGLRLH